MPGRFASPTSGDDYPVVRAAGDQGAARADTSATIAYVSP